MPKPGRGTEFCKFIPPEASKEMQFPLIPVAMPALSAHLSDVRFLYSDNKYYELCGLMGHLIGPSGSCKAQLTHLIEARMRDFRAHDAIGFEKMQDWQRQIKTRSSNKEKHVRPEVALFSSPAETSSRQPSKSP